MGQEKTAHEKEHPRVMHKLAQVLEGWDGYQTSLLHATAPLTNEQLSWRPAPGRRSLGELARHICMGRITWLARMGAPGTDAVARRVPRWHADDDGTRRVAEESVPCDDAASLAEWFALSWQPIQRVLAEWTVDDYFKPIPWPNTWYQGSGLSGEFCPMTSTTAVKWPPCWLFKASKPSN
jgi:DinB superfamily